MAVKIHFLNTGSGDCAIIHFPERLRKSDGGIKEERIMMLDLNHHEDNEEVENVIEYYKNNFRDENGYVKPIFRFVCSHPHHDHICGIHKLFDEITVWNFWDINHEFKPESFDGHPWHKDDWEKYEKIRKGGSNETTIIKTHRKDTPRLYWNNDEDRITILSPSLEMIEDAHKNDDGSKKDSMDVDIDGMSYALAIQINSRKIIFGGDGRVNTWDDIVENCKNDIINCDILKAPHHGHESAFHEEAVKLMNPKHIIISNSEEQDKDNGAGDKYQKTLPKTEIYKTYDKGTIIATIPYGDKENVSFSFSK